jgi:hypothetical protein
MNKLTCSAEEQAEDKQVILYAPLAGCLVAVDFSKQPAKRYSLLREHIS